MYSKTLPTESLDVVLSALEQPVPAEKVVAACWHLQGHILAVLGGQKQAAPPPLNLSVPAVATLLKRLREPVQDQGDVSQVPWMLIYNVLHRIAVATLTN